MSRSWGRTNWALDPRLRPLQRRGGRRRPGSGTRAACRAGSRGRLYFTRRCSPGNKNRVETGRWQDNPSSNDESLLESHETRFEKPNNTAVTVNSQPQQSSKPETAQ
eukprot:6207672-Pyramimonas_sp.AAC.1